MTPVSELSSTARQINSGGFLHVSHRAQIYPLVDTRQLFHLTAASASAVVEKATQQVCLNSQDCNPTHKGTETWIDEGHRSRCHLVVVIPRRNLLGVPSLPSPPPSFYPLPSSSHGVLSSGGLGEANLVWVVRQIWIHMVRCTVAPRPKHWSSVSTLKVLVCCKIRSHSITPTEQSTSAPRFVLSSVTHLHLKWLFTQMPCLLTNKLISNWLFSSFLQCWQDFFCVCY